MIYELPDRQILVDGLVFTKEFKVKKLMIVVLGIYLLSVSTNAAYTRGYMKKTALMFLAIIEQVRTIPGLITILHEAT